MTDKAPCHVPRLPREPLIKEAETMDFWTAELECTDHCYVNEHVVHDLIDNEIIDPFVPPETPTFRPHKDYTILSEVEKFTHHKIKTAVEVTTDRIVTGIVEKTIENAFAQVAMYKTKVSRHQIERWWKAP